MAVLAVVQVDSLKHRCDDLIRPIGWTDRERGDTSFERMDTARFSPCHVGRSLILRRVGDPHMEASGEPDQLVPEGRIDHYRDAVGGLFPSHFRVHRAKSDVDTARGRLRFSEVALSLEREQILAPNTGPLVSISSSNGPLGPLLTLALPGLFWFGYWSGYPVTFFSLTPPTFYFPGTTSAWAAIEPLHMYLSCVRYRNLRVPVATVRAETR